MCNERRVGRVVQNFGQQHLIISNVTFEVVTTDGPVAPSSSGRSALILEAKWPSSKLLRSGTMLRPYHPEKKSCADGWHYGMVSTGHRNLTLKKIERCPLKRRLLRRCPNKIEPKVQRS